jgi:hypothetical protein
MGSSKVLPATRRSVAIVGALMNPVIMLDHCSRLRWMSCSLAEIARISAKYLTPRAKASTRSSCLTATFLTAHAGKLVHEHPGKAFFGGHLWVGTVVPINESLINDKAVLVKDGLQGVDNSVFLTGGCAYFLKVHTHLHLLGVFLHEFHDGTITKVRLNETQ